MSKAINPYDAGDPKQNRVINRRLHHAMMSGRVPREIPWRGVLTFALLALFLWLVWPTPWAIQTERFTIGSNSGERVVRVHRWTGQKQVATKQGWE